MYSVHMLTDMGGISIIQWELLGQGQFSTFHMANYNQLVFIKICEAIIQFILMWSVPLGYGHALVPDALF